MTEQLERVARVLAGQYLKRGVSVFSNSLLEGYIEDHWEEFTEEAQAAIEAANVSESTASLDERMKSAGMFTISDLVHGETPLDKWKAHVAVKDYDSFEWLLKSKYEEYTKMQVTYDLDKKPEDDLYEWVLAHVGAYGTMLSNWKMMKQRMAETSIPTPPTEKEEA